MSLISKEFLSSRVGIVPGRESVTIYPYVRVDTFGTAFQVLAELRPVSIGKKVGGKDSGETTEARRVVFVQAADVPSSKQLKLYDVVKTADNGTRYWSVHGIEELGLGQRLKLHCVQVADPLVTSAIPD